jgi:predicted TIM-barrel fold metal-dependent hydrolase
MIIDIHYHLMNQGWDSKKLHSSAAKLFEKEFGISSLEKLEKMLSAMWDPSGEKAIKYMDEGGIDKCTLLVTDWGFGLGETEVSIEEQNRICAQTAKRYPDRLTPFAGIDPRRKNAIELLKRCVEEWGMKGLKFHPDVGFFPDDESFYPFYEKVSEYKIPILSHTGPMFGCLKSKYVQPVYLDAVLADFPDINIIAAHLGFCWWPEVAMIGSFKPNLYGCLTGWQLDAQKDYAQFCHTLRTIIDKMGPDRILFGTDGPYDLPHFTKKDWVNAIKSLPEKCPEGITFTHEEVAGILGGNAQKLLGL